jgi:uncharacterized protein YndB with AHSA1/START domain
MGIMPGSTKRPMMSRSASGLTLKVWRNGLEPNGAKGGRAMTADSSTGSTHVVVSRELDVPPEVAWRAWCEPDQVRQWWGPTGFSCPRADIDFRVGGTSLVTMQAPAEYSGFLMHNRWTYTKIEEPSRLEFISTFADDTGAEIDPAAAGIESGVPREVPHVVEFEPLPEGRTRVTVSEFGYTSEEARNVSQGGQEQVMDKMQALYRRS